MLLLQNVELGYLPGTSILSVPQLELTSGIYALCGSNGSGKTTFLRALAGVLRPLSGSVSVQGVDIYENPRGKRVIGYLPHRPSLYPDLTVAENLEYWGRVTGLKESEVNTIAVELKENLDLTKLWNRPAGQLSRGQKQRVALARTLLHRPRLLVLDEPTTGFDADTQDAFAILVNLRRSYHHTMVFSTHRSDEVEGMANGFLDVRNGEVVLNGKNGKVPCSPVVTIPAYA